MSLSIAFSAFLLASSVSAAGPALVFEKDEKEIARLDAGELSAKVKPVVAEFHSPFSGKTKKYRCWPMAAVMDAVYGKGWNRPPLTEAALIAADGYGSQAAASKLSEDGGCLAFEDLDGVKGQWEPVGAKKKDPAPYFLVWTKPEQTTANAYPWPWNLAEIGLIRFEKRYPEVVPRGAKEGSPEWKGYQTFRAHCMRCHAVNQQGGKIGPDLNAPTSVSSYRTEAWVKSYVRAPSKVRYTEMPDHPHLTDEDLDGLWRYFKLKATQPEKSW